MLDDLSSRQVYMAQVGEQGFDGDSELRREVQALQERRLLRTLAVIQDVSDSTLALNDIRGDLSTSHCPLHGSAHPAYSLLNLADR